MNFFKFNNKKGFSLVELMLVISIIALFATFSVISYMSFRESVVLSLAYDNFKSQVFEQKNSAIYGVNTDIDLDEIENLDFSNVSARCYGVYIRDNRFYKFSQDYFDKKVWDDVNQIWQFSGCANFEDRDEEFVDLGEGVLLESEDFVLRFVPPKGDMELSRDFLSFESISNFSWDLTLYLEADLSSDFDIRF